MRQPLYDAVATPLARPLGQDLSLSAPAGSYTLEVIDAAGAKASTFDLRASDPPMVVELPLPGR